MRVVATRFPDYVTKHLHQQYQRHLQKLFMRTWDQEIKYWWITVCIFQGFKQLPLIEPALPRRTLFDEVCHWPSNVHIISNKSVIIIRELQKWSNIIDVSGVPHSHIAFSFASGRVIPPQQLCCPQNSTESLTNSHFEVLAKSWWSLNTCKTLY